MPRPEVDPAISARFAEKYKKREGPNYRVEENVLFIATRGPKGHTTRNYAEEINGGRTGSRFVEVATAIFEPNQRLPILTNYRLDPNKPWGSTDSNSASLLIHEIPGRDEINLSYEKGDLSTTTGIWVAALVDRERDRLAYLGLWDGKRNVDTEVLRRLRSKTDVDVYLAEHGIVRDRDQGTVQLTLGDWVVKGSIRIPTEAVLHTLYPNELRDDHFGAPAAHDGWIQTDLFAAFGITITPPAVENPVFVSPTVSQTQ